jgi:hypothetical protein
MIKNIEEYFDGGTIEIILENGESYAIDDRLFTETKYQLYKGYPRDDNSNLIDYPLDTIINLLEMINNYNPNEYDNIVHIKKILKENLEKWKK